MSAKKKALILVNAYARELYTRQVSRLSQELQKLGAEVQTVRNGSFPLAVGRDDVPDCDFCVFLDKDKYTAQMLEKRGVKLFNSARAIAVCDDKMLTHIALENSGVPMPFTVPGPLCYFEDVAPDAAFLDSVEARLGYPLVVKLSHGSQGSGVFKADNRRELDALAKRVMLFPHLYQRFISSSYGKDMRVIVIGGKTVGGIIRASATDFRSNIGLGGKASKCDVPPQIKELAEKTATALELDYCGIDFLLGEQPLVCEVNSNAFFDAFEQATNINVAGIYAQHMLSSVK